MSLQDPTDAPERSRRAPPDADAERCPYCGAPFPHDEAVTLHKGLAHPEAISDAEREAFATAYDAERERLRSFQLRALAGLVVLYFGFLFAYALFP